MEASISEIPTIDHYQYLGRGYFEPRIDLEDYVLKLLSEGPMTRGEMVQKSGVPRTTLFDALQKLILHDEVTRFKKNTKPSKLGRLNVYYILRKHIHNFEYFYLNKFY